jgi:hypothetical protein
MTSNSDDNETNTNTFGLEDLYAAAFVLAHGIRPLRVESGGSGRKRFVFPAVAREHAEAFYRNEPAPARALFRCLNDLRGIIKTL